MSVTEIGSYVEGVPRVLNVTEDGRIVTLAPEHNEVHNGTSYVISDYVDILNAGVGEFLFSVPDMAPLYVHSVLSVQNNLEALYEMFEDVTVSANGVEFNSINRNRNSTNESLMKVYASPTVTSVGTRILRSKQGIAKQYGGSVRSENEYVLKNNTNYMLRITNLASGTNTINGLISWYEHLNAIQVG